MWRHDETLLDRTPATAQSAPHGRMNAIFEELDEMSPSGFSAGLHIRFASPLVYVRTYSAAWQEIYDRNAYALRDPLVFWSFGGTGATRWSAISLPDPFGILTQAREHGLQYGMAISHGPITSRSILGAARADREFTDTEIARATRLLTEVHEVARQSTELTKAQIEALRLLSEGDRHAAAAGKLGITESAFKARLQSARTRLGARTTAQALKKAREYQLL